MAVWFYCKGRQRFGPVDEQAMKRLASEGQFTPRDLVWREGMSEWVRAVNVPGLFDDREVTAPISAAAGPSQGQSGPDGGGERAAGASTEAGAAVGGGPAAARGRPGAGVGAGPAAGGRDEFWEQFSARAVAFCLHVFSELKLFVRRVLHSDFYVEKATPQERARLETASIPATAPLAQDYAAWRRSVLWLVGVMLVVTLLSAVVSENTWMSREQAGDAAPVINTASALLVMFHAAAAALVLSAAANWHHIGRTRQLARWGWVCLFFGPFLVFMIPWSRLVGGLGEQERVMFGAIMGFAILVQLMPKVFGLFPGMIRACLTLKTLLPEASAPGWVALIVAPFYALFFSVFMLVTIQIDVSVFLTLTFACLMVAPLVNVFNARRVMAPADMGTAHRNVAAVRRQTAVLLLGALVCGIISIFTLELYKLPGISVLDLVVFFLGIFAAILLLMVVVADLLLGLLNAAFGQARQFAGSSLQQSLDARFTELTQVGMTQLEAGEGDMAARLRSFARRAGAGSRQWLKGGDADDPAIPPDSARPASGQQPPGGDKPPGPPPGDPPGSP